MALAEIVVADDDDEIRSLLTDVLEEAGYSVHGVSDGLSALTLIRELQPALALLDVAMPVMTGDETLQLLRAEGSPVPVVILTAGTYPQRFLQVGAVAVVPKPFDLDLLLATVASTIAPPREQYLGA